MKKKHKTLENDATKMLLLSLPSTYLKTISFLVCTSIVSHTVVKLKYCWHIFETELPVPRACTGKTYLLFRACRDGLIIFYFYDLAQGGIRHLETEELQNWGRTANICGIIICTIEENAWHSLVKQINKIMQSYLCSAMIMHSAVPQ